MEERGELPFAKESFDIAYARQVLHHAADLSQFCVEIFRILKKGGIFLACREHVVKNEQERKIFLENHSLHKLTMTENAFRLEEYCEAIGGPVFLFVISGHGKARSIFSPVLWGISRKVLHQNSGFRLPRSSLTVWHTMRDDMQGVRIIPAAFIHLSARSHHDV